MPRRAPSASSISRPASPAPTPPRRTAQDPHRVQTWRRAEFADPRSGGRLGCLLPGRPAFRPGPDHRLARRSRSPASPLWSAPSRSRSGGTIWPSTPPAASPPSCPRPMTICASASTAACCPASSSSGPRDRRAIQATGNALLDAMGQIYVQRHFPASARADVQTMVRNIVAAFDRRLQGATWLAPATLAEARRKVETVTVGIGYPDRWRDYSRLEIRADDAFGNAWRAQEQEYRHQLAKLGQPVDRNEWWLGAHTVNAVFLPLQNAMNFPAGILEPPFYDRNADPAYNYGAIGSVIGHEISHSFDNLGAEFDAEGRLRNWWTAAGPGPLPRGEPGPGPPVQRLSRLPGPHPQRHADARRGPVRPGRPRRRLRRLARLAERPRGAGDRRPDRRPALLPGLCPEPAREHPRGDDAQPDRHRRPLAGPLARRNGPQPRRLVQRVQRAARAAAVSGAGTARVKCGRRRPSSRPSRKREKERTALVPHAATTLSRLRERAG